MITVGIDARFLTHPQHGGFKTYTTNLVLGLSRVDQSNRYILFIAEPEDGALGDANKKMLEELPGNFHIATLRGMQGGLNVFWREQVALPWHASRQQVDVLHCPASTAPVVGRTPLVITIHDTIWNTPRPAQFADRKRVLMHHYYRYVTSLSAKRAESIITVSKAAKNDIQSELNIPADRIHVTYEAPSMSVVRSDAALAQSVLQGWGIRGRYVLGLGSADPRKNVAGLLKMFAMLPRAILEDCQLVIVWAHPLMAGSVETIAGDLGIADRIVNVCRPSDAELSLLYRGASAFVFPSLKEGFGLPLLEAMAHGTPVVAAENSSIPEVAGSAALYYPTHDYTLGTSMLEIVLQDEGLARKLKTLGQERASQFSWDRCAEQTREVYESVVSAHRRQ